MEEAHGRPFAKPVVVHLCAPRDSFNRRIGRGRRERASGAVVLSCLLLSPKAFRELDHRKVLAHELSHLHLRQSLGTIRSLRRLPSWFQEGIAVYGSYGGDALPVTLEEAAAAVLRAAALQPESVGALRPRSARDHRLEHFMFYRQSGMFVTHLAERDPAAFRAFMAEIQDGRPFAEAFQQFGQSVEEAWRCLVAELRAGDSGKAEDEPHGEG